MTVKTEQARCALCGKLVVLIDEPHFRIDMFTPHETGMRTTRWGHAHRACFERWSGKASAILDVLDSRDTRLLAALPK